MPWRIEFDPAAKRELDKLDRPTARRLLAFLIDRLAPLDDPRALGEPLKGPTFADLWRFRVGDYRLIVDIRDGTLTLLVLRIGHRRQVYRR